MSISGENFEIVIFLSELSTQCNLAKKYGNMLRNAAPGWRRATFGQHTNDRVAPIDIIAWCTVCLSSMGVMHRILFAGNRTSQRIKDRCNTLHQFLGIPALPNLSSKQVRNAWEHLDERLDATLVNFKGKSISEIHVHEDPPSPGTVVLKRFDPVKLVIHFGSDKILLEPCLKEIDIIDNKINAGFKRLQAQIIKVWP